MNAEFESDEESSEDEDNLPLDETDRELDRRVDNVLPSMPSLSPETNNNNEDHEPESNNTPGGLNNNENSAQNAQEDGSEIVPNNQNLEESSDSQEAQSAQVKIETNLIPLQNTASQIKRELTDFTIDDLHNFRGPSTALVKKEVKTEPPIRMTVPTPTPSCSSDYGYFSDISAPTPGPSWTPGPSEVPSTATTPGPPEMNFAFQNSLPNQPALIDPQLVAYLTQQIAHYNAYTMQNFGIVHDWRKWEFWFYFNAWMRV